MIGRGKSKDTEEREKEWKGREEGEGKRQGNELEGDEITLEFGMNDVRKGRLSF